MFHGRSSKGIPGTEILLWMTLLLLVLESKWLQGLLLLLLVLSQLLAGNSQQQL